MYKYEKEIQNRIQQYDWQSQINVFADCFDGINQAVIDAVYRSFKYPLSANARRALDLYYEYDEQGVFKKNTVRHLTPHYVPTKEIACADASGLPDKRGLYFLGMIGQNPDGENYYLIKIGGSDNIRKRVSAYATYNPMLYIGGYYVIHGTQYKEHEHNCHCFLQYMSQAMAQNAKEWYYVSKEDYFALCKLFSDKDAFEVIANGEVIL